MKRICVLGLGYIGLPTAAMFALHGLEVVGVDTERSVVAALGNGEVHIEEPGLKALVGSALVTGNLRVATRPEPADAFIIAVPTPFDNHGSSADRPGMHPGHPAAIPAADLSYVRAAAHSIVPHLTPGALVILESTVPPRTTLDVLAPILAASGLSVAGRARHNGHIHSTAVGENSHHFASQERVDVYVAHCPERVLPGRILEELVHNDRVIGGADPTSTELARSLYSSFVQGQLLLTDATTAEMVKLMENTYRDVNIALANEFALVARHLGIDGWKAIELANHHPRVNILKPGPGVGGHCIAVDPWFIAEAAPQLTPLIQTARRVNDSMPARVVRDVKAALADIAHPVVACLGLAYKADVDDIRESPSVRVVEQLIAAGFVVRAYDPYVAHDDRLGPVLVQSLDKAIAGVDAVVVLTDHDMFRRLTADDLRGDAGRWVLDTRNCLARRPTDAPDESASAPVPAGSPLARTLSTDQGAR